MNLIDHWRRMATDLERWAAHPIEPASQATRSHWLSLAQTYRTCAQQLDWEQVK